jgi:hypothetical protein
LICLLGVNFFEIMIILVNLPFLWGFWLVLHFKRHTRGFNCDRIQFSLCSFDSCPSNHLESEGHPAFHSNLALLIDNPCLRSTSISFVRLTSLLLYLITPELLSTWNKENFILFISGNRPPLYFKLVFLHYL